MSVRVYVEGGGDGKNTSSKCRHAFASFFEKMLPGGSPLPKVIASGTRRAAYEDFGRAFNARPDCVSLLLVDSEGPVRAAAGAWEHLHGRDGWQRPANVSDDTCHLMVQCMESWLLADPDVLIRYYGQDFLAKSLPDRQRVEEIEKQEVMRVLKHSTRHTQKGEYHKTRHGFDILASVDPNRVCQASQHAQLLRQALQNHLR